MFFYPYSENRVAQAQAGVYEEEDQFRLCILVSSLERTLSDYIVPGAPAQKEAGAGHSPLLPV
jgi:hypothetical protein